MVRSVYWRTRYLAIYTAEGFGNPIDSWMMVGHKFVKKISGEKWIAIQNKNIDWCEKREVSNQDKFNETAGVVPVVEHPIDSMDKTPPFLATPINSRYEISADIFAERS